MATSPSNPGAPPPAGVGKYVACVTCGYDLRGLDRQAQCPECHAAVARAWQGDRLRYADRRWLWTVTLGVWVVYFAQCAAGAMYYWESYFAAWVTPSLYVNVSTLLFWFWSAMAIASAWLLSVRDPRLLGQRDGSIWLRGAIRLAATGALVLRLLLEPSHLRPVTRLRELVINLGVVSIHGLAYLGCFWLMYRLAARLEGNFWRRTLWTTCLILAICDVIYSYHQLMASGLLPMQGPYRLPEWLTGMRGYVYNNVSCFVALGLGIRLVFVAKSSPEVHASTDDRMSLSHES